MSACSPGGKPSAAARGHSRHPLCGVRSGAGSGRHHRRRRARHVVQAARRRLPLLRARPGRRARPASRRARRVGIRDASARDAAERHHRPIRAPDLDPAGRRGGAAAARADRPALQRRACRHLHARGAGDRAAPRGRRPGARVPQPARLCANAALHRLRLDRALSRLRRAAHRASRGRAAALPSLRRRQRAARALSAVRVRGEVSRPGHRADRGDIGAALSRAFHASGWIATSSGAAATWRRRCAGWLRAKRASWSARRW